MANILSPKIQFKEFAGQYLVGNFLALLAAVIAALVAHGHGISAPLVAIIATIVSTIVWYLYILLIYLRRDSMSKVVSHLLTDFGLAEGLDTFLFRPVLMYILPLYIGQALGVALASVIADVIYTAIAMNRQRHRTLP